MTSLRAQRALSVLATAALLSGGFLLTTGTAQAAPGAGLTVTADHTPPPTPTGVKAVVSNTGILVSWTLLSTPDVDHYTAYVTKTPTGTPYQAERVGSASSQAYFADLPLGKTYYVRVFAADKSGNTGVPSAPIAVILVPAVAGLGHVDITGNVVWGPSQAKEFVVRGGIIIEPGASLTLQPGTIVRFAWAADSYIDDNTGELVTFYAEDLDWSDGLYVRGGGTLKSLGTTAKPVILTSGEDPTVPAVDHGTQWHGVFIDPAGHSTLTHTQVRHSESGVVHQPVF